MIALGIRYLTGRCVAADANRQVEFPPHPARVFMALAAAHFDSPAPDPDEREALCWLERQPAPAITARTDPQPRSPVEAFVPANDTAAGIADRPRTARSFASAFVGDDPVLLRWPDAPAPAIHDALARLCSRVTRIGHSSSPVQMWLADADDRPAWTPAQFGSASLRVAMPGALDHLADAYRRNLRPQLQHWQPYRKPQGAPEPAPTLGPFDSELIILARQLASTDLNLATTLQLTGAIRSAMMKAAPATPAPEWVSGHGPGSRPSLHPHAAFFPLPFVDHEHADGHLLGVAIAVPRGIPDADLGQVLGPLLFRTDEHGNSQDREFNLWCGNAWKWTVRRETAAFPRQALRADTWTAGEQGSMHWASVTPVVLHHYPKPGRDGHVEKIVREACLSAGFPAPSAVTVSPAPFQNRGRGIPHIREFPVYEEGGEKLCRFQTHVRIAFDHPVRGPVLIGRGRFRGYGLLRPMPPPEPQATP